MAMADHIQLLDIPSIKSAHAAAALGGIGDECLGDLTAELLNALARASTEEEGVNDPRVRVVARNAGRMESALSGALRSHRIHKSIAGITAKQ